MRFRSLSILSLFAALLVCVVLATRWAQARTRSESLVAEIDALRRAASAAAKHPDPHASVGTPDAPIDRPASIEPEFEARKALLAQARALPELARREATLLAVRRIKAQHEESAPSPRVLPPPVGSKFGPYFTELFADPEYLVLVREDWMANSGELRIQSLDRLGVSDETKRQVLEIEFDSFLASHEMHTYTIAEERHAAVQERRRIDEENLARVRQLLGDEGLRHYRAASTPGATQPTDAEQSEAMVRMIRIQVSSGPLAVRLSYTNSALTTSDQEKLQALISTMATPRNPVYRILYDVEFFKQAQSILNPTQLDALRQLQEENEARTLRSRLPKSSELPRTTRRARLEPDG